MGNLAHHRVDVVCPSFCSGLLPYDRSLDDYVVRKFDQIHRISIPSFIRAISRSPFAVKWFIRLFQFPDWAHFLNARAEAKVRALNLEEYKAVVTWSQFHSIHLLGAKLKREHPELPWIAHISDPWADNPFRRLSPLRTFFSRKMEREVVRLADKIVFTSSRTVDLVMKKYPAEWRQKASAIPHPFDEELFGGAAKSESANRLVFRYVGWFYNDRTPEVLLKALVQMERRHPEVLKQVKFEFVGGGYEKTFGLSSEVVEYLPPVNYLESLKLMGTADVLVVIDAPGQESVFLPSKLVDYIGAQKPILGITPPGTSRELILELGGHCANPADPEEILQAILAIAEYLKEKEVLAPGVQALRQKFSAREVGLQMEGLLGG